MKCFLFWALLMFCICYSVLHFPGHENNLGQLYAQKMPHRHPESHSAAKWVFRACTLMFLPWVQDPGLHMLQCWNLLFHWTSLKVKEEIVKNFKLAATEHSISSVGLPVWLWSHFMKPVLLKIFISKHIIPNSMYFLLK